MQEEKINNNSALAVIEHLYKSLAELEDYKSCITPDAKSGYLECLQQLRQLINILDTDSLPIELISQPKLLESNFQSQIDKLGIGGEVIRLRKMGKSIREIADSFNINSSVVSRFFKYYDSMKNTDKIKYEKRSVFDLADRLEELFITNEKQLHRLEGYDDKVAREYSAEMQKNLTLAMQIIEKRDAYEAMKSYMERLSSLVSDLLLDELPNKRYAILKSINELTLTLSQKSVHTLTSN